MKVLALSVRNFMAIGEADIGLDDRGLVLIQGENRDDSSAQSNGSGKSSLADALSWCLYGVTARGEAGDTVINRHEKSAMVAVTLADDDKVYRVMRFRKDRTWKNKLAVVELDPATYTETADLTLGTDALTQQVVDRILGSSVDVFNAAIYAGQERMPNLPDMTDKQLKELVEEAGGITVLQECYRVARERASAAKSELQMAERDLINAQTRLELEQRTLAENEERYKTWGATHRLRVEALAKQVAAQQAEADRLLEIVGKLEPSAIKISEQIALLRQKVDGIAAERSELQRHEDALSKANDVVIRADVALANTVRREAEFQQAFDEVDSQIGKPCSQCGQVVDASHIETARHAAINALAKAQKAVKEHKKTLRDATSERVRVERERNAYVATMTDASAAIKALDSLREAQHKIERARDKLRLAQEDLTTLMLRHGEASEETNPHKAAVLSSHEKVARVEAEIEGIKGAVEARTATLKRLDEAVVVFGPAGVRAHILDHLTPFLNARTAHYLSTLSDGNLQAVWNTLTRTKKGEVREKFQIEVTNATGGANFRSLSGGEKRKVRLACAMALQDVVAARALKPIDFFLADEIDDALDEAGLERLMGLLDEKARERGTVLVISHRSLSDWIRETVTVVKEGGRSKLEGAGALKL